jgi:hypothetical protein
MPKARPGNLNPNWKGGPIKKVCEICGINFQVKPVHKNARFCSMKCVGISQRGRHLKSPKRIIIQCRACGKDFSDIPSHLERNKTCSVECRSEYRSQISKGEKNGNWNGGLSRQPYAHNFSREISKTIIKRDDFRCHGPLCSGKDSRLVSHHINYKKEDNEESNLITLCNTCNSMANFNREKWTAYFQELVKIKVCAEQHPYPFRLVRKVKGKFEIEKIGRI